MTSTGTTAPRRSAPAARAPRRPARALSPATRRTLQALLASGLGVIPLKSLFSDYGWAFDVWITMVIVLGPAALIRLRRAPGALDIWPGIVLLVPWLTARFVHTHAYFGIIPSGRTWHDLSRLMTQLHETTRDEVAPIHTTVAVRLVVCALLGLLAALIDLIAVVGRRGALAGVPLLVVYTVAGAVPRKPVSWIWFAFAAVAYLVLLALDASDDLEHWGRRVQSESGRGRSALSISTPRIAVAAIAAAVVLPLLVPGSGRNLIANAFHGGGNDSVGSFGDGGGGSINPFAALSGQLNMHTRRTLATVEVTGGVAAVAKTANLRMNVLDKLTPKGFGLGSYGPKVSSGDYPLDPPVPDRSHGDQLTARIKTTSAYKGTNPPVFADPDQISGLSTDPSWSPQAQLLVDSKLDTTEEFTETFSQPEPSAADLASSPYIHNPSAALAADLQLYQGFPASVRALTAHTTAGAKSPYQAALAIQNFFLDPTNGFTYRLSTTQGDSQDELVNFLDADGKNPQGRQGFCQQFAAAGAAMMRAAGVPARVVLGYMHEPPNADGGFTVRTSDAHAWVEAYFQDFGWLTFDTTPAAGLSDGGLSTPAYSQRSSAPSGEVIPTQSNTSTGPSTGAGGQTSTSSTQAPVATSESGSAGFPVALWLVGIVLVVVVVALLPALTRWSRRRRRLVAARRDGNADALWAELSDTATDLGYVWSEARTPRQVAAWLGRDAVGATTSLQQLATAVEQRRYAPPGTAGSRTGPGDGDLVDELQAVTGELRARRSGRARARAVFWPASLGWTTRWIGPGGRRRR